MYLISSHPYLIGGDSSYILLAGQVYQFLPNVLASVSHFG
jgi:hypothetical protein